MFSAGVGRVFKTAGVGVGSRSRFFKTAGVGVRSLSRNPKKSSDSTTLSNKGIHQALGFFFVFQSVH